MTNTLSFKGLDIRSRPLTFQRSHSSAALVGAMFIGAPCLSALGALPLTPSTQREAPKKLQNVMPITDFLALS